MISGLHSLARTQGQWKYRFRGIPRGTVEMPKGFCWLLIDFLYLIPMDKFLSCCLAMDVSLSELRELVMDREADVLQFMGSQSRTRLSN